MPPGARVESGTPGMRHRSPTRGCPAPGTWAPRGPVPGSALKAELADIRKRNKETQPQACRPPLSAHRQTTLQLTFMKKSKKLRFKASRFRALAVTLSACSRVREGASACQVLGANSNADTRYTQEDSRSSWGPRPRKRWVIGESMDGSMEGREVPRA
jgi:hypothetical protein